MPSASLYTTDRIRNVVVVGHGGAGKTTLIDACCHAAGTSRRHGTPEEGTALTMFTPEEVAHAISMNTSVAYAEWQEAKINFIDPEVDAQEQREVDEVDADRTLGQPIQDRGHDVHARG